MSSTIITSRSLIFRAAKPSRLSSTNQVRFEFTNARMFINCVKKINNEQPELAGKEFYPGFMLTPDFISSKKESDTIISELNYLKEQYSFKPCNDMTVQAKDVQLSVSAIRVTGRPEGKDQIRAPWGYGDNFNLTLLKSSAPSLFELASRLCSLSNEYPMKISNLRDITINYRFNGMFKLDPHIDPLMDGENVFILGLKSDTVLTLTPDLSQAASIFSGRKTRTTPLKIRTTEEAISTYSWTDADIDILMRKGSLLHLWGDARFMWKHAIRTGVVARVEQEGVRPKDEICDWFGDFNTLVPREKERISVILAFK